MKEYPECEKMQAVQKESQAIGQFLDHMGMQEEVIFCRYSTESGEYEPVRKSIEQMLSEYFEIDLVAMEKEKVAMLEACRL